MPLGVILDDLMRVTPRADFVNFIIDRFNQEDIMAQCEHCAKLKNLNFLQGHYNQYRDAGGEHAMYAVYNDLSDETARELGKNYKTTHPPVSKEKVKKFHVERLLRKEAAERRDDLEWLTGTGRYGQ